MDTRSVNLSKPNIFNSITMNLNTKRLTLQPFSAHTFEEVYQIFINDFVKKYLCDNQNFSKEDVRSFLETSQQTFRDKHYGLWTIALTGEEKVIGFTGLWHFFDEEQPQLLYALLPNYTGKGYAQEASRKIMDYAFDTLQFSYLDASCDAPNLPSHKTALALGMQKLKEEVIDDKPTTFYRKLKT